MGGLEFGDGASDTAPRAQPVKGKTGCIKKHFDIWQN